MFQPFRSWLLLGLLSLPLLTATVSCTKKEDTPTPAATTGGIEGTISPANAIATVTATNTGSVTFLQTPAASGTFTFANLVPGAYTLTCDPKPGFQAPNVRYVTVVAGQVAPAGTIVVAPEPLGTVAGIIDPADAVTRVELVSSTGIVAPATPNASTGAFSFAGVALGIYTVRFVMAPGFYAVPDITGLQLSVRTPDVNLNTITAQSNGIPRGTMTWTTGGATYSATSFGRNSGNPNELAVTANSLNSATGTNDELAFYVSYAVFSGVGTYPLGVSYYATAQYTRSLTNGTTATYRTLTNAASPTGSIVVTSYNASTRTAAGTFAFAAANTSGPSAPLTVTNGTFNLRF